MGVSEEREERKERKERKESNESKEMEEGKDKRGHPGTGRARYGLAGGTLALAGLDIGWLGAP